jgi:hypothetical protein
MNIQEAFVRGAMAGFLAGAALGSLGLIAISAFAAYIAGGQLEQRPKIGLCGEESCLEEDSDA